MITLYYRYFKSSTYFIKARLQALSSRTNEKVINEHVFDFET